MGTDWRNWLTCRAGRSGSESTGMRLENVEDIYPLSPAQQGMLFHDLYAPASGVYCVQLTFTIGGRLDVAAFRRSWQAVLDRHPAMRTAFAWEGLDQPLQVVRKQVDLPWSVQDWRGTESPSARFEEFLRADRLAGFDVAQSPLMRVALVRTADDGWRCVWSHHHLVLDGWSVGLVLRDVLACYVALAADREPAWPASRRYRDYIAWLQRQDLARADAFWRETLRGISAATPLGIAGPLSADAIEGHFHTEQQGQLDEALTARLQVFARQNQLTLNTLVTAAVSLCLGRYSGEAEIVLGTAASGRPADLPGADSVVGMFINTLPLRVSLPEEQPMTDWLRDLQVRQADMMAYAFAPLVRIQQQSSVPAGQPLFDSILVFENYPVDESLAHAPAGLGIGGLRGMEQTNYPLAVHAVPGPRLILRIGHDRRRVDSASACRMLGHLRATLEAMIANPRARLGDVSILQTAEEHELLECFNESGSDVPGNPLAHELFELQARRTPDAIAAICGNEICTYRELDARAAALAERLRALGIGPETRVGICLQRSVNMLVAVLGALKAGGAYVPLDPAFPRQRLAMMIEDAGPRAIVTERALTGVLPESTASLVFAEETKAGSGGASPPSGVHACMAAYVLFTSGSTGRPKGVVIEHRMLANFLLSMGRHPGLQASDKLVAVTTLSFDIAGLELLLPLTVGASVIIATAEQASDPAQLQRVLAERGATVMQATPATWRMLLESGWAGSREMRAFCGGEALTRELADRLLPRVGELYNLYGPTETTIWSSVQNISPDGDPIVIGRPIANTRMYILDRRLRPVPIGVTGELYIAGAGVARGYLQQPGLTAERFGPDPYSRLPGGRQYRTGDLARYRSDGTIECLGRIDHQVKIRGFRIELGEIESALARHPSVRQAIVADPADAAGGERLIAYWVPSDDQTPTSEDLRQHLGQTLPEYMVPSVFVQLAAFPLTPNGKIDRKGLPAPASDRQDVARAYRAPSGREEETLAEIWSQLLGRSPIGAHDHFFELGGHSLLATRLASKIREALGVALPLRAVFDAPILAALAERVRSARPADAASDNIAIEVEEGRI